MGQEFKYELGSTVKIIETEEVGVIVGRTEYLTSENKYYVKYESAPGVQVTNLQEESCIEIVCEVEEGV